MSDATFLGASGHIMRVIVEVVSIVVSGSLNRW